MSVGGVGGGGSNRQIRFAHAGGSLGILNLPAKLADQLNGGTFELELVQTIEGGKQETLSTTTLTTVPVR